MWAPSGGDRLTTVSQGHKLLGSPDHSGEGRGAQAAHSGGLACGHSVSETGLFSLSLPSVLLSGQGQPLRNLEE